jgi:hypothetical protein
MVADGGVDANTEICAWAWTGDPGGEAADNPSTWKDADYCINGTGTLAILDQFVGGGTTVEDWDTAGTCAGPPDDCSTDDYGYPANGQTDAATYNGSTSGKDWEWVRAGELTLP